MSSTVEQPSKLSQRGRVAALTRSRPTDDPELVEAKRNLKALSLEEYVRRVVSQAPPLTDEQRDRIAALLRAGGAA